MAAQKNPFAPTTIIMPAANAAITAPKPYKVTSCDAGGIDLLRLDPVVGVRRGDRVQRIAEATERGHEQQRHGTARRPEQQQHRRTDRRARRGESDGTPIEVVRRGSHRPVEQHSADVRSLTNNPIQPVDNPTRVV